MSEPSSAAPAAPASAPAAPSTPQNVISTSNAPARARASDFETAMEQRNNKLGERNARAIEEHRARSLQDVQPGLRDPKQRGVDGEEAYGLDVPVDLEDGEQALEPEKPKEARDDANELGEQPSEVALRKEDAEILSAAKEWLDTGTMPERFRKMQHEWVDKGTGALRRQTIEEMEEGNMRQSDYSTRMNQVRGFEQQVQFRDQANNQFWQTIREPEKMVEEFEDRDYGETFEKAAILFAQRRSKMKGLAEAAGYALMQQYGYPSNHPDVINAVRQSMQQQQQLRQIEIQNRRLQKHNQMLAAVRQQQDTQQQQQQRMAALGNSLSQLIPTAFKVAGVRTNPANTEAFYRHLNAYVASLQNWDGNIRRQHCVTAAQMVREELEDRAALSRPKQVQPQSRAMGPSRLGQSGRAAPTQEQRKRPSDFGDHVQRIHEGR